MPVIIAILLMIILLLVWAVAKVGIILMAFILGFVLGGVIFVKCLRKK